MKNFIKFCLFFLTIVCFFLLIQGCSSEENELITIKGSTTMAPVLEKLVINYTQNNNVQITIEPVGSLDGIKSLIEKKCLIASTSMPVSKKLVDYAKSNNVKLKTFPLCRDEIITIVNTSNPLNEISLNQLKEIFVGETTNWVDLGGSTSPIQTVLRKETSGTNKVWINTVLNGKPSVTTKEKTATNSGVLAIIAENKKAIGYISAAFLNHEVKQLIIKDKNKVISIERTLFLFVDENRFPRELKAFISFLYSDSAKKIIKQNGFNPEPCIKHPNINL